MSNPARRRPHLADADYYRLGFQLAAQLMNRAAPGEPAAGHGARARTRGTEIENDDPLKIAEDLLADARAMLAWYEHRRTSWMRWRALSAQEDRLRTFLASTIVPCCALLAAQCLLMTERADDARPLIENVRRKHDQGTLSYRAYYSLACLEANIPPDEPRLIKLTEALYRPRARGSGGPGDDAGAAGAGDRDALTLDDLLRALRDAPQDRRAQLAEWALGDPAFRRLRPKVRKLVAPFRSRPAAPAQGSPSDEG